MTLLLALCLNEEEYRISEFLADLFRKFARSKIRGLVGRAPDAISWIRSCLQGYSHATGHYALNSLTKFDCIAK